MADIGKELAELIHEDFKRRFAGDKWSQRIIREGTAASMDDVAMLAHQLGRHFSSAVSWHINDKNLPLGEDMENIARQILEPILQENFDLINRVADDVQRRFDKARGINIEPQHAKFPRERADTVYKSAAEPGKSPDVIKRRMTVPPETITQSMSDRYMKANVDLRSKAGFETYIVRTDDGNCCPWCSKLVGKYPYPEGTPKDVFRRHDNCGCRVVYECGNMRQNVHTKETWEQPDADIPELVKNPDVEIPKLVRDPDYQIEELYRANALTTLVESGIIESRNITLRNLPNGLRTAPGHILTDEEIKSLKKDIAAIGADEKIFKFNVGHRTGYDDILDEIRVKGDIIPDLSSNHPRDRMSARAALAHEYYGHRAYRGTKVPKGAWNDEFRASYMAAKKCPNLTDEDRYYLILDALERAKESGITIKNNAFIRGILYGY